MNTKFILIILGEPYSTFSEIIGKYFSKQKRFKKNILLIGNLKLLKQQLRKLNYSFKINQIKNISEIKKNKINMLNINFNYDRIFSPISSKSTKYIEDCFYNAIEIINSNKNKCILINGPVSKKAFLKNKFLGVTEYLSNKTFSKDEVMLIYNKKISVSPLTTHIPIKYVSNKISKNKICKNILKINLFYQKVLKKKVKFAVLGLNPHCESIDKISEEKNIITPAVKILNRKGLRVDGPFPSDTFFLKKNIDKYQVVIGMYHDQVLTPIKTLFNFNAINITLGLPFIRISPDHGPNSQMLGKNKSDPSSFIYAMKFAENLK